MGSPGGVEVQGQSGKQGCGLGVLAWGQNEGRGLARGAGPWRFWVHTPGRPSRRGPKLDLTASAPSRAVLRSPLAPREKGGEPVMQTHTQRARLGREGAPIPRQPPAPPRVPGGPSGGARRGRTGPRGSGRGGRGRGGGPAAAAGGGRAGFRAARPGRCPWCRRAARSLTACSRRRRCRRSRGRGRTRAPRGRRSRPCLRRRRGRPTWGCRGERFAGAEAARPGCCWDRGGERRPGSAEAAICAGGGSARIYQSGPRGEALKGTGACGAEGVSAEGAGRCRRVWPRPNPSEIPAFLPPPGKGGSCPLEGLFRGWVEAAGLRMGQPSGRRTTPSLTPRPQGLGGRASRDSAHSRHGHRCSPTQWKESRGLKRRLCHRAGGPRAGRRHCTGRPASETKDAPSPSSILPTKSGPL